MMAQGLFWLLWASLLHSEPQSFISEMPPRYRTLISPQRVCNPQLIAAVEQALK